MRSRSWLRFPRLQPLRSLSPARPFDVALALLEHVNSYATGSARVNLELPWRYQAETIPRLWEEELGSNPEQATSANSYSWIVKGRITEALLADRSAVLNVGCGFGRELLRLPASAVGVDIENGLLRTAKRVSNREVILADAHHLPFRDGVFDGVAITEVIEHLHSPPQALSEISRVMIGSGKIVLQTPNRLITLGIAISKKFEHVHEFTYSELSRLMERMGFTILTRTGSTIPYVPSTSRLRFLNEKEGFLIWKWINNHFKITTWDLIVLAEKKA